MSASTQMFSAAKQVKAMHACLATLAIAGATVALPASATNTATTTFNVTATVLPSCLVSATDLAFGNYSGAEVDVSTTLSVTCNTLVAAGSTNLGLDAGTSTGATVATRKMTGALASTVGYGMYKDSAHTQNWGNTVGTDTLSSLVITVLGLPATVTVYGKMPSNQFVAPGTYSDVVTVTLTY